MKYRHGIVWPVWVIVVSISLTIGASGPLLANGSVPAPSEQEMERLFSEKLERLSAMEKTRSASPPGPDAESGLEESGGAAVVRPLFEGQVDCDAGGSVQKALAGAFARRVVLHLSGTCRESVVVDRPGVTLTGSLSGTAVIDPPDEDGIPIGPAVYAFGAHELTLEDLTLRGGTDGLEAHGSRKMQLTRVSAVENDFCGESCWPSGVYLNGSEATIVDSDLSSNFGPLWVERHSTAIVTDTVMENNDSDGPFAAGGSYLSMQRCSLLGNGLGPQAFYYSTTIVADSSVGAPGSPEWSAAWSTGSLLLSGTEIHGDVSVSRDSVLGRIHRHRSARRRFGVLLGPLESRLP
jgi:hypothetical protein